MKSKRTIVLGTIVGLFLIFPYLCPAADGLVTILSQSMKPSMAGHSTRSVMLKWKVRLRNDISLPVDCSVKIDLVDSEDNTLEEDTKECRLAATETKTVAKSIRIQKSVLAEIANARTSVECEKSK